MKDHPGVTTLMTKTSFIEKVNDITNRYKNHYNNLQDYTFYWRLSKQESAIVNYAFTHLKHETWQEPINKLLLRILV